MKLQKIASAANPKSQMIHRRAFLVGLLATLCGTSVLSGFYLNIVMGHRFDDILNSFPVGPESFSISRLYLSRNPAHSDPILLRKWLWSPSLLAIWPRPWAMREGLREYLIERSSQDFRSGRTYEWNGWTFSETQAALVTLAELTATR